MFETLKHVGAPNTDINLVVVGISSPVLLLHGYPQIHGMWHKIAPALAERFTVMVADLRGNGNSAKLRGARPRVSHGD